MEFCEECLEELITTVSSWIYIVYGFSQHAGLSLHGLGSVGSLGRGPQGPWRQGPQVPLGCHGTSWDVIPRNVQYMR